MQVSTRERDYVVDTIALRSSLRDALAKHFLDASKLKVFHGADMDVQWLQRDFGIYIVGKGLTLHSHSRASQCISLPGSSLSTRLF